MDTKDIIIICLTVIVVALIIGCAIALTNSNENIKQDSLNMSNTTNNLTVDRLSSDPAPSNDDNDIVSEKVKFNAQAGEGYYKEVTYKDGGFRQFDLETGKLIGSSYKSDQSKLPSME